eukprot:EC821563.1.p1 GENE.EC821563.1~~EC821563.1.p1  ORF type:complete len:104 (+),score=27.82 EC821563.1:14-325(+)
MGEQISKKDANPILVAILNFILGGVGYLMIGQKKKGITSIIIYIVIDVLAYVISTLLCVIGIGLLFYCFAYCFGFIFSIFTAIDGHKVATNISSRRIIRRMSL